jgi:hypothetical protein
LGPTNSLIAEKWDSTGFYPRRPTRFHRAARHRGHLPNEQAAMKALYLIATTRCPNRENLTGRISE